MSVKENKELVRRFFTPGDDKWVQQALKAPKPMDELVKGVRKIYKEFFTPDCVSRSTLGTTSLEDDIKNMAMVFAAVPDVTYTLEDMFGEGDKVVFRYTVRGNQVGMLFGKPPTGNKFESSSIWICRFAGGKIAEVWAGTMTFPT